MYRIIEFPKHLIFAVTMVLLFMTATVTFAEETASASGDSPKQWRSPFFSPVVGNLYFLGGAGFHDMDALNGSLSDNGYSELKSPTLSLGLGTDIGIGRLILGLEWHRLVNIGTDAARNDLGADINSRYWLARVGVDVAKWRGLRVYPLFGIGTGTTRLNIASENGASFDEVLADPGRDTRLRETALLLDASLGIDYRFKVKETEYKSSFFTVGVRGGYLFAPYSGGWKTGGAEISGGPNTLLGGPTVMLMLGFSGEHKKMRHVECGYAKQ